MTSINSDYMSQMVLQSLTKTDADMTRAMQRLSTGKELIMLVMMLLVYQLQVN